MLSVEISSFAAPNILGYHMNATHPTPRTHIILVITATRLSIIFSAISDLLPLNRWLVILFRHRYLFLLFIATPFYTCRSTARPPIPLEPASRRCNVVWRALRAPWRVRVPHVPYRALREHPICVTDSCFPPSCAWSATCSAARYCPTTSARRCGIDGAGLDVVVKAFDDVSCCGGFF